jgi:hypothetical protein
MSIVLWILLAALYLTALIVLGFATLRKGHTALFWLGIVFPLLWIVGALMAPTAKVAAAEARAGLQRRSFRAGGRQPRSGTCFAK